MNHAVWKEIEFHHADKSKRVALFGMRASQNKVFQHNHVEVFVVCVSWDAVLAEKNYEQKAETKFQITMFFNKLFKEDV